MSSIVFIDSRVQDYERLIAGLGADTQVVILDPALDGVIQIATALTGLTDLDSIHIISHGSSGTLYLGSAVLTEDTLDDYEDELAQMGASLSEAGDLLLYGCNVGAGETGESFIASLADRTGADVAASDDITGSAALGGDWVLETAAGAIESNVITDVTSGEPYAALLDATPPPTELSALDGTNGFRIAGGANGDLAGISVSSAGDVNGDGFDDLLVGANGYGDFNGAAYIVFGKSDGFSNISLSALGASDGFRITGGANGDEAGFSVSSAGDVNGDGFDDLLVGATGYGASNNGAAYVVFGKSGGFTDISLSALGASDGFRIAGGAGGDFAGSSVSSAGDVNGDGFADLLVGAYRYGAAVNGAAYIVFGKSSGFTDISLSALGASDGFRITGGASSDRAGVSVSSAGDVNGDGFADLLVGADRYGASENGAAYVVFGKSGGFTDISLSALGASDGFRITGGADSDYAGQSVSSAGDVNGDGFADLLVGASGYGYGASHHGAAYVVFGKSGGFTDISLSALGASDGFRIMGGASSDRAGFSVSSAGDVNGDGFDDLLVGARGYGANKGAAYVVFGKSGGFTDISLSALGASEGFRVTGGANSDNAGRSVSAAGDVNGDGFDDLVVGAYGYGASENGAAYVVFGGDFTGAVTHLGTNGADTTPNGTSGAETFVSAQDNDTLTGGGGADVFRAGQGNDLIEVADTLFRRLDGGSDQDTLALTGAGLTLDLTALANNRITGIEVIDLTGSGANTLALSVLDALDLSRTSNVLCVDGNASDEISMPGLVWSSGGISGAYHQYVRGSLTLRIDAEITVSLIGGNGSADAVTGIEFDEGLFGFGGDDTLEGGEGDDTLDGGADTDTASYAGAGSAVTVSLSEAGAQNTLGAGTDTLSGIENLTGGSFNDTLIGAGAGNVLDGGVDADSMAGGDGHDIYVVDNAGDSVSENAFEGTDTVQSSVTYTLGANLEHLTLTGGVAINGTGNSANNNLTGNSNANVLDGEGGADSMVGGDGNDTYVVDSVGDIVDEISFDGIDTVQSSLTYTLGANLEELFLTGEATINATGNELANSIWGNAAANILDGGLGGDAMIGGDGDDTYIVDDAEDDVVESTSTGTDQVHSSVTFALPDGVENLLLTGSEAISGDGNGLANVLTGNSAANVLDGSAGADSMSGGNGDDTYIVSDAEDTITEGVSAGTDTVLSIVTYTLSSNLDHLILIGEAATDGTGNGLANEITGNSAANRLDGDTGADSMVGGDGNDTYVVDNAGDSVSENSAEGTDTVQSSVAYTLGANLEHLTLTGDAAINGTGNGANNNLTGNSAVNVLDGGIGADSMTGGDGDDTYVVDNSSDTVTEDASSGTDQVNSSISYTLTDNVERLTLTGSDAIGGTGNGLGNVIIGNSGNNVLAGGAGDDTLTGSDGNDTFVIAAANGIDRITDFADGDLIDVVGVNLTLPFTAGNGTSVLANQVRVSSSGGTTTLFIGLDGTPGHDLSIQLADSFTANQFRLIGNDIAINHSPAVASAISDKSTQINNLFSFTAPTGTFADADADETIIYTATREDGTALPSWLTFNPATRAFSGTPLEADLGTLIAIKLVATDAGGASGFDVFNVFVATDRDAKNGTGGPDTLDGGTGADTLTGFQGNDTYIVDNAGDQVIETNAQDTDLVQASVTYSLPVNVEILMLTGGSAINGTGNALNNQMFGNGAANRLNGGLGIDTLSGGAGNDTYVVDNVNDQVNEGLNAGTDTVEANSAVAGTTFELPVNVEKLTLMGVTSIRGQGNTLNNTLTGNSGNNSFTGGGGNDSLVGVAGNDTLDGGLGVDTMLGGTGNDTYIVDSAGDVVTEGANAGTDLVQSSVTRTLETNVDRLLLLGSVAINGTGNVLANQITGNGANNVLLGGDGNDTLSGGGGNDSLRGGAGDDSLDGGAGNDSVYGEAGDDTLLGGTGVDLLDGGDANDSLDGGDSNDTLTGGTGNDTLQGGAGTDSVVGGTGNDVFFVNTGTDVVVELAGGGTADQVVIGINFTTEPQTFQLYANVERVSVVDVNASIAVTGNDLDNLFEGSNADDLLNGAAGDDTIDAAAGDDTLNGGTGADSMEGGDGNDLYFVGQAGDAVVEDDNGAAGLIEGPAGLEGILDTVVASINYSLSGVDFVENVRLSGSAIRGTGNELGNLITGNSLANTLAGLAGKDTIEGGAGKDTANGGGGNDRLEGDGGKDTLTGGVGKDKFEFDTALSATGNVDRITDFRPVDDTIQLDRTIFTKLATGNLASQAFYAGAAAHDSSDRIIYNGNTGSLYYDADGNDNTSSAILFATLAGTPTLAAADFFIVA